MAVILDAILDFEECQQGISGDFLSVILHIFLDLSWKNQLVTKNVQVKTNIIGLLTVYTPIVDFSIKIAAMVMETWNKHTKLHVYKVYINTRSHVCN